MSYQDWKRKKDKAAKQHEKTKSVEPRYWLAINGPSVAAWLHCALPAPARVVPTPQVLVGFLDKHEAADTQQFLLTAPMADVQARVTELVKRSDVKTIKCESPEPPTQGETHWEFAGEGKIHDWHDTPIGRMPKFIAWFVVDVSMTVDDIRRKIRGMASGVNAIHNGEHPPFLCACTGFDSDPRELWQIPEVHALAVRLVESGLLGLMHVGMPPDHNDNVWCALDIWALSQGLFKATGPNTGMMEIPKERLPEFLDLLDRSNQLVDAVLAGTGETPAPN